MAAIHTVAKAVRIVQKASTKKWSVLAVAGCVFFVSFLILEGLDLVPNPPKIAEANTADAPNVTLTASPLVAAAPATPALSADVLHSPVFSGGELPKSISIPAIGRTVSVANPMTTNIEKLDAALLSGAVRYPTGATLGTDGNVVIFAHSSYLPVVNNQSFKAFNDIQKLKAGDTITVYSSTRSYDYAVESVAKVDASDAAIPLSVSGSKLTLSTCDSFGAKSERFVVVANLVASHALGS
jgi:LPXTG-site transpeptidase (sortase) family protein